VTNAVEPARQVQAVVLANIQRRSASQRAPYDCWRHARPNAAIAHVLTAEEGPLLLAVAGLCLANMGLKSQSFRRLASGPSRRIYLLRIDDGGLRIAMPIVLRSGHRGFRYGSACEP
jgi:hypothetical protein